MSVSSELLCSFELLKPLDSSQLKSHIKKGRNKRNTILNSPVSLRNCSSRYHVLITSSLRTNTHNLSPDKRIELTPLFKHLRDHGRLAGKVQWQSIADYASTLVTTHPYCYDSTGRSRVSINYNLSISSLPCSH